MSGPARFLLLDLHIAEGDDGTAVRHVANRAARGLGLGRSSATRVATAVSELGRLGARHAPTTVTVETVRDDGDRGVLQVRFGFGLDGWRAALDRTGLSAAAGRLVDEVEVTDTGVTLREGGVTTSSALELTALRHALLTDRPGDPRAVLASQNSELLGALTAVRDREAELVRVNGELEQTNRGVVALYAELERRAAEIRQTQRAVFVELERALRPPPLLVSGLELDVRYLPSQVNSPTGGDLYDWVVLPDGCLHIAVVDVLGHGVTSTRDALRVTHTLRTLVQEGYPLDKVLERANTLLDLPGHPLYATALVARFDPQLGQLEVAGAGHPPALLVAADGSLTFLDAPGRPLGYPQAGSNGSVLVDLGADDCVLLYTDGLVEVRQDIVEGLATLETAAIKAAAMRLPQLLDTVLRACLRNDPLRDDTLLLGLRWQRADGRGSRDDLGVSLPHSVDAPAMARQYLMERASGLSSAVLDDALVVLSEIVGNAVRHGRGPVVLRLAVGGGGLRVEVRDSGEPFEHDAAVVPPIGPSSGRGLFLVQRLATRWGVAPADGELGGKTVWFEF